MQETRLTIDGLVEKPLTLSMTDLAAIAHQFQVPDVSVLVPGRRGRGVMLHGLLEQAAPHASAAYITLHSTTDDFHASVPLSAVRETGVLVYEVDGQPLPASTGGPFRFLLPDVAACHTAEVDECANVKFVDRLELTGTRGFDNRPSTKREHERLHAAQQQSQQQQ
ncbi:MAG: molybdopterin-dependent oxidoreductase [Planctomycetes bacterium]|nr:molybdopterin-dependent oxidoreductase [Planctomycetota bacterium]